MLVKKKKKMVSMSGIFQALPFISVDLCHFLSIKESDMTNLLTQFTEFSWKMSKHDKAWSETRFNSYKVLFLYKDIWGSNFGKYSRKKLEDVKPQDTNDTYL